MRRKLAWRMACWVLAGSLAAAASSANEALDVAAVAETARAYRVENETRIVKAFRDFLSIPNISDLPANAVDMDRNAAWIVDYLAERDFTSEIVEVGRAPYVLASRMQPGATVTILIYAHFDGQPVDALTWHTPPFEPTLRTASVEEGGRVVAWLDVTAPMDPEWRIFARSAGDDKAPLIALMTALDALDEAGIEPSVNIKLILDGEEEAGSPTLARILEQHGDRLNADLMLFCDGPMHQSRRRQLVFGVRGSMTIDLTTYGPIRPVHSGHYGNWAPNPTDTLVRLLTSLKDDAGEIAVAGFDDDVIPLTEAEREAIAAMPDMETQLVEELALGRTEGSGDRLELTVMKPAIVIKGLQAGGVGSQSSNVIRPSATASLNVRLVPDQTPDGALDAIVRHIKGQGFHIVYEDPARSVLMAHGNVVKVDARGGYPGFRTRLDGPEALRLASILNGLDQEPTLLTPTMGGSLPIYLFERSYDMPIVLLPIANHDNNQHGSNENLRIQNLWDAIEIFAVILASYGAD
ncbi:MAG: M20/M25/M40 family metallo-hydrolase [Gammaproteobacteria bacterium]|nr:M20/M25/M40 family metallo-hydrolase [Gammaproteobacteria bacterium]